MVVLNETKIKYEHLDTLLNEKLIDIRFSSNVNVIIDLKEVIRKFFRPNILPDTVSGRGIIEEITSDIINIIGHYRNYFYKKDKYTSFYFLYSQDESTIMKAKNPDYKREYYEKYFTGTNESEKNKVSVIKRVIKAMDQIVNHIPNAIMINTTQYDEYTVARFMLSRTKDNEINIILSNDEVMAQLLGKNTFMLNIKGINSKLLDEKNAVSILTGRQTELSINLLPLLLSFSGTSRYSLKNLDRVGLIKALRMVEGLVKSGKVMDTKYVQFPFDKEQLSDINSVEKLIKDNFEIVKSNYEVIDNSDVLYTNKTGLTLLFNKPKASHSYSYYLDLNSKVFTSFPLNLEMLLKGETLK